MTGFNSYNSYEQVVEQLNTLQRQLEEAEGKYDQALTAHAPEPEVFKLGLEVQNIRRTLIYFQERLNLMEKTNSRGGRTSSQCGR